MTPDDSTLTVAGLDYLATAPGRALLAEAVALGRQPAIAAIGRLRQAHPHEAVAAALTLAGVQEKALGPKGKFRPLVDAARWKTGEPFFAPPEALEQATAYHVAALKAERFRQLGVRHLLDLCAGVGGDTLALATVAPTLAVEQSPARAHCIRHNTLAAPAAHPVSVAQRDVTTFPFDPGIAFHLDPARRSAGRRTFHFEDLIPGPSFIHALLQRNPTGALKLSPAVDFESLPEGMVEVISDHRTAVAAVLWTGELADLLGPAPRRATILQPNGTPWSLAGEPEPAAPIAQTGPYFYEVDPAVTRAGLAPLLARQLALAPANVDGGYLTGSPLPQPHPALTAFEVETHLPWSEKRLAAFLESRPQATPPTAPGAIEFKTRGGLDLDTDRLQKQFSKIMQARPTPPCTVLLFRDNSGLRAVVGRRVAR